MSVLAVGVGQGLCHLQPPPRGWAGLPLLPQDLAGCEAASATGPPSVTLQASGFTPGMPPPQSRESSQRALGEGRSGKGQGLAGTPPWRTGPILPSSGGALESGPS